MRSFILGNGHTRHSRRIRRGEILIIRNEYASVLLKGLAHTDHPLIGRRHFKKTSSYRGIRGLNVPDYGGKIAKETLTHVGIA
jgi:hypothetical protein